MKVLDVYNYIDSFAPFASSEAWDNTGLLTGDSDSEVTKALVCLDVSEAEIEASVKIGANLIISHHPAIFSPLRSVTADSVIYKAVKNGISIISAHTNLDRAAGGVNDALCELLSFSFRKIYSDDSLPSFINICEVPSDYSPEELALFLKERLSCTVSYCAAGNRIGKTGLCTGAGADFIDDAIRLGCNAFITGEAKYHEFLSAKEKGVSLFAVGHFESEAPVIKKLTDRLNAEFNCTAFIESDSVNSVITVK